MFPDLTIGAFLDLSSIKHPASYRHTDSLISSPNEKINRFATVGFREQITTRIKEVEDGF